MIVTMVVLNKSQINTYKLLAKQSVLHNNEIIETDTIIIDLRSLVYKYLRNTYSTSDSYVKRINCVFNLMPNLKKQNIEILHEALNYISEKTANYPNKIIVVPTSINCPFKTSCQNVRKNIAKQSYKKLQEQLSFIKENLLNIQYINACYNAYKLYCLTNVGKICLLYRKLISRTELLQHYIKPTEEDFYESDRLCARLSIQFNIPVFTEDFDCIALFGASSIIYNNYTQISLETLFKIFMADDRNILVKKCCLLSTDYNYGVYGIGPGRILSINNGFLQNLFEDCMNLQNINIQDMLNFFNIN